MHFILELAIIVLATKLAGSISVRLGQPSVLGKIIIGIVLGPAMLGWIEVSEMIEISGELGVILLMFIAGLETNLQELKSNGKSSLAVATGGIIFPLAGGYLAGMTLGMDQSHAVFLGLMLSATSVSISVQTLKELGRLKTKESTTLLGAAVLDDILVVVLLAFTMSFFGGSDESLVFMIGKIVFFFATIIIISWKAVPFAMRLLSKLKISEPIISAAIVLCLFFSYYAEILGVAAIIGAFIAGIAIAQTPYKKVVEQKVEPIAYSVFVPVFFVSIGLHVSFTGLGDQIWFIVLISLLAVITKFVGAGLGARVTGFNTLSSVQIGAGMISRGEVALILATIGYEADLVAHQYFTPLIIVIIVSTIVTPPALKLLFGLDKEEKVGYHLK